MLDKLIINDVPYPLKFGYGAFRSLGKKWECKGTAAVFQKLSVLDGIDDAGMSFDQEQMVLDLAIAGIDCAGNYKTDLPGLDLIAMDVLLNADNLSMIFSCLMSAMPKAAEPTNKKKAASQKI